MSDYPDNWKFEDEGKSLLVGKLKSVNAVTAADFNTGEPVQKFVANIETDDGTVWAVWLDSAVLNRAFRDEAQNRMAQGDSGFAPDEAIEIEYLGKRKGAKFSYKDFRVEFENAAPSVGGFAALAGQGVIKQEELPTVDVTPLDEDATASEVTESGMLPADEEIPF